MTKKKFIYQRSLRRWFSASEYREIFSRNWRMVFHSAVAVCVLILSTRLYFLSVFSQGDLYYMHNPPRYFRILDHLSSTNYSSVILFLFGLVSWLLYPIVQRGYLFLKTAKSKYRAIVRWAGWDVYGIVCFITISWLVITGIVHGNKNNINLVVLSQIVSSLLFPFSTIGLTLVDKYKKKKQGKNSNGPDLDQLSEYRIAPEKISPWIVWGNTILIGCCIIITVYIALMFAGLFPLISLKLAVMAHTAVSMIPIVLLQLFPRMRYQYFLVFLSQHAKWVISGMLLAISLIIIISLGGMLESINTTSVNDFLVVGLLSQVPLAVASPLNTIVLNVISHKWIQLIGYFAYYALCVTALCSWTILLCFGLGAQNISYILISQLSLQVISSASSTLPHQRVNSLLLHALNVLNTLRVIIGITAGIEIIISGFLLNNLSMLLCGLILIFAERIFIMRYYRVLGGVLRFLPVIYFLYWCITFLPEEIFDPSFISMFPHITDIRIKIFLYAIELLIICDYIFLYIYRSPHIPDPVRVMTHKNILTIRKWANRFISITILRNVLQWMRKLRVGNQFSRGKYLVLTGILIIIVNGIISISGITAITTAAIPPEVNEKIAQVEDKRIFEIEDMKDDLPQAPVIDNFDPCHIPPSLLEYTNRKMKIYPWNPDSKQVINYSFAGSPIIFHGCAYANKVNSSTAGFFKISRPSGMKTIKDFSTIEPGFIPFSIDQTGVQDVFLSILTGNANCLSLDMSNKYLVGIYITNSQQTNHIWYSLAQCQYFEPYWQDDSTR